MAVVTGEPHPDPDAAQAAAWLEDLLRRCGKMLRERQTGASQGRWAGAQYKDARDLQAHEFLVQGIRAAYPHLPVVSEEDASGWPVDADAYFIIDPIDGTASYAHGYPGWVTQAAYVRQGIPQFAGIYAPATDEYFEAVRNRGAFANKRRLAIAASRRAFSSLIDNYPEPAGIAREAMAKFGIGSYVESGSIALKICRIADGTADLFIKQMSPRDWDLAAPMLVLEEAGGVLADAEGRSIVLGTTERRHDGLIATTHAERLALVSTWLASVEKPQDAGLQVKKAL